MCAVAEVIMLILVYIDGYVVFKLWEVIIQLSLILEKSETEYWAWCLEENQDSWKESRWTRKGWETLQKFEKLTVFV